MSVPPLGRVVAGVALSGLTFLVTLASTGCGCDAYALAALDVSITDARTGAPAAGGATVVVVGPAFTDSVMFSAGEGADARYYRAWGREAGRYTITVRKSGYEPWTRERVRVREAGPCNRLETVVMTAALVPAL